jgi:hypothetical protein
MLIPDLFVITEQVADLPATDSDNTGGDVGLGTDMPEKLSRKGNDRNRMTSSSDLPFGSKSEPPFATPMGRVVREVLEYLLKAEKLQDAEINGDG